MSFYVLLIVLNCLACIAIFISSCMRILKMDKDTRHAVRGSIVGLAALSIASGLSPFTGLIIGWQQVLLTVAFALVQITTAPVWNRGAPRSLQVSGGQRAHHA